MILEDTLSDDSGFSSVDSADSSLFGDTDAEVVRQRREIDPPTEMTSKMMENTMLSIASDSVTENTQKTPITSALLSPINKNNGSPLDRLKGKVGILKGINKSKAVLSMLSNAKGHKTNLRGKMDELRNSLDQKEVELATLQTGHELEIKELNDHIFLLEKTITGLNTKVSNNDNKVETTSRGQHADKIKEMSKKLALLEIENRKLTNRVTKSDSTLLDKDSEIRSLHSSIKQLRSAADYNMTEDTSTQISALEADLRQKCQELTKLEKLLTSHNINSDNAAKTFAKNELNLKTDLQSCKEELFDVKGQLRQSNSLLEGFEKSQNMLAAELEAQTVVKQQLQSEIDSLKEELSKNCEEQLRSDLTTEKAASAKRVQELQEIISSLKEEILSMRRERGAELQAAKQTAKQAAKQQTQIITNREEVITTLPTVPYFIRTWLIETTKAINDKMKPRAKDDLTPIQLSDKIRNQKLFERETETKREEEITQILNTLKTLIDKLFDKTETMATKITQLMESAKVRKVVKHEVEKTPVTASPRAIPRSPRKEKIDQKPDKHNKVVVNTVKTDYTPESDRGDDFLMRMIAWQMKLQSIWSEKRNDIRRRNREHLERLIVDVQRWPIGDALPSADFSGKTRPSGGGNQILQQPTQRISVSKPLNGTAQPPEQQQSSARVMVPEMPATAGQTLQFVNQVKKIPHLGMRKPRPGERCLLCEQYLKVRPQSAPITEGRNTHRGPSYSHYKQSEYLLLCNLNSKNIQRKVDSDHLKQQNKQKVKQAPNDKTNLDGSHNMNESQQSGMQLLSLSQSSDVMCKPIVEKNTKRLTGSPEEVSINVKFKQLAAATTPICGIDMLQANREKGISSLGTLKDFAVSKNVSKCTLPLIDRADGRNQNSSCIYERMILPPVSSSEMNQLLMATSFKQSQPSNSSILKARTDKPARMMAL